MTTDPELAVRCRFCGAQPGKPCRTRNTGTIRQGFHRTRTETAKRVAAARRKEEQ